jgi:hypothetical protein
MIRESILMQKLARSPRAYISARIVWLPRVMRMIKEKKQALNRWMR